MSDLFVMALIEGPFQRLVGKKGLMNILVEWKREMDEFGGRGFNKERADVDVLVKRCLELSVDAVILADDLAGEHSPFIDPNEIRDLFSSYYTQMVSEIHSRHSYALFHSCGNITLLIPQLVSFGFDGLAGIQHRTNDLVSVKEKYGSCFLP